MSTTHSTHNPCPQHERMKAESARQVAESTRQAEETARKNELTNLTATVEARDSEIATLREQISEMEKTGEVSKKCLKTIQV